MSLFARSAGALIVLMVFRAGEAAGQDGPSREEVQWLVERLMLRQARDAANLVSGHAAQWRHAYGKPQPREVAGYASVWLLDYPGSVITTANRSVG
jgi:hypothetical protein